jgi:hypothetical protein
MAKKDYTNTFSSMKKSSGIAVLLQPTAETEIPKLKKYGKIEKKKKASVLLNLPAELKRKMDFYCLDKGITKHEFIIDLIENELK